MNVIEIPFDEEKFKTKDDFNSTVSRVISLLLDLDYVIKVYNDGYTTSVEFELDPSTFGGPDLQWVDPEKDVVIPVDEYEELCSNNKTGSFEEVYGMNYYADRIEQYLASNDIDLVDFFLKEYSGGSTARLSETEIADLIDKVNHYKETNNAKDIDRIMEENEQH